MFTSRYLQNQRKAEMAGRDGAFNALPGGYRMLEELFEMITLPPLGIHTKHLMAKNSFLEKVRSNVVSATYAKGLIRRLEVYELNLDELLRKLACDVEPAIKLISEVDSSVALAS